jgi:hypothetical protein
VWLPQPGLKLSHSRGLLIVMMWLDRTITCFYAHDLFIHASMSYASKMPKAIGRTAQLIARRHDRGSFFVSLHALQRWHLPCY